MPKKLGTDVCLKVEGQPGSNPGHGCNSIPGQGRQIRDSDPGARICVRDIGLSVNGGAVGRGIDRDR